MPAMKIPDHVLERFQATDQKIRSVVDAYNSALDSGDSEAIQKCKADVEATFLELFGEPISLPSPEPGIRLKLERK